MAHGLEVNLRVEFIAEAKEQSLLHVKEIMESKQMAVNQVLSITGEGPG